MAIVHRGNASTSGTLVENLFFHWRHSMTRKFTVSAFAETALFAQRFPANTVLARLADPSFQYRRWFSTHHAFFERISHGIVILFLKTAVSQGP
jgi:hypothetical protein